MAAPDKPPSCSSCALAELGGKTWSRPEGTCSNGVLGIGEALGKHEAWDGLPFRPQADAGSELERAFRRLGRDRQTFALWNLVGCWPPRNHLDGAAYERSAILHCRPHMDEVVKRFQPKVIVAFGRLPTRELTGLWGEKQGILLVRGFICDNILYPGIPVIPTIHPSFIVRGGGVDAESAGGFNPKHLRGTLIRDLQLALKVAQSGFSRPKEDYWIFPPLTAAEAFYQDCKSHPELTIFTDIETAESIQIEREDEAERSDLPILQIQFSIRAGHAIVLPWEGDYIAVARKILSLPNAKAGWNFWEFDVPVLRANQTPVEGPLIDSMAAWRMYQPDLPQGLQVAASFAIPEAGPWKHLHSSDRGVYGGRDSNFNLIVHNWILERLERLGMLDVYQRHVERYHAVLRRISARGIPVEQKELSRFGEKLEKEMSRLEEEMQRLHPDELKEATPKCGYVKDPEDTSGMVKREFSISAGSGKEWACLSCMQTGKVEKEIQKQGRNGVVTIKQEVKCEACDGKGVLKEGRVERWCRLLPFRTSQKQILSYIRWKMEEEERSGIPKYKRVYKVPVVKRKGEGAKETTEETELEKLYNRTVKAGREDLLLKTIRERRKIEKLLSSYIRPWRPGEDGRVHATFRFSTATGQLAAVRPNVLTLPKKGALQQEFRKAIRAPEGYWLVEADWNAFHAKTLGLEAQDAEYMRLASLDIHSFVACHMLKLPDRDRLLSMDDSELKDRLRWLRSQPTLYGGKTFEEIRNEKAKPLGLGIGFGQSAADVYRRNEESFEDETEVERLKDMLKSLFPKVFQYQEQVVWEAYEKTFLLTRYHYIRWFWDAKVWDSRSKKMKNGSEAEAAMAFRPANDAHGMLRDVVLKLEEDGLAEKWGLILPFHDALYFLCPDPLVEECCHGVKERMEAPNPVLADPVVAPDGFRCGVDVKLGRTLHKSDMKEWKG